MPKSLTLYTQRFPASHRWLVEQRVDDALREVAAMPEWTGDLQTGECVVVVQLVEQDARRTA